MTLKNIIHLLLLTHIKCQQSSQCKYFTFRKTNKDTELQLQNTGVLGKPYTVMRETAVVIYKAFSNIYYVLW